MFKDKKLSYMTKAIQGEVTAAIQLALWGLIDARVEENAELDYFQIFELSPSEDGKRTSRSPSPRSSFMGKEKSICFILTSNRE